MEIGSVPGYDYASSSTSPFAGCALNSWKGSQQSFDNVKSAQGGYSSTAEPFATGWAPGGFLDVRRWTRWFFYCTFQSTFQEPQGCLAEVGTDVPGWSCMGAGLLVVCRIFRLDGFTGRSLGSRRLLAAFSEQPDPECV